MAVSTRGHRGLARNAAGNSGPTSYSSESSAIEAVNLGVGGYLVKPFRAADVMAVVARALSVPAA
ncbi:MAG TPA: hypothetical protein VFB85_06290 [Vicinamibacterales bacterium]|nr:hypothetical protein [Vicinamibacterales bacterium]